jgi:protein-S-isoprenylcysteine O-methyltransferase Ste14
MATMIPLIFPIIGNLLAIYLILHRKHRPVRTMLGINLVASVLFGVAFSVKVFYFSAEPSLWPMPLVFAPLEYWRTFGIAIAIVALALFAWSKRGS